MALTLNHYRFGIDSGTESTHGWHAAEDTVPEVGRIQCDTTFLLRFSVQETAGTAASNIVNQFQYRVNSGTWTNVTTTSTHVRAIAATALTNGGNCTKRLSGTGTFEATAAGQTEDGNSGGTANDIVANGNSETECGLQIVSSAVNLGDLIEFRLTTSPTAISTYAVTPSVKVAKNVSIPTVPTGSVVVAERTTLPTRLVATLLTLACAACTVTGRMPVTDVAGVADWPFAVPTGTVTTTGVNFVAYDEYRSFWGTVPSVSVTTADMVGSPTCGTHTVTGTAPVARVAYQPVVPLGAIQATGTTVLLGAPAYVPTGTVAVSGITPDASLGEVRELASGSAALTATAPTRLTDHRPQPAVATVALSGTTGAPSADQTVEIPTGALRTGLYREAPHPQVARVAISGSAPTSYATYGIPISVPVGSAAVSGTTPSRATVETAAVPCGTLALAGAAPRAACDSDHPITVPVGTFWLGTARHGLPVPPVGAVLITGCAPIAALGEADHYITTATGSARASGVAPELGGVLQVPTGTLTLSGTGFTAAIVYYAPPGTVALTGVAPAKCDVGFNVPLPCGALTLARRPPLRVVDAIAHPPEGVPQFFGTRPVVTVSPPILGAGTAFVLGAAPTRFVDDARAPTCATVALSGTTPSLGLAAEIPIGSAAFSGTLPATTFEQRTFMVPVTRLEVTGLAPTRTADHLATPSVVELGFSGTGTHLAAEANSDTGVVALTGAAPTRVLADARTPEVGELAVSLTTPMRVVDAIREVPAARVSLGGTTPAIDRPERMIPVPVGTLAVTPTAPQREGDHQVTLPVLEVAFSATLPARFTTGQLLAGSLRLTGAAVTRRVAHLREVPVAQVAVSGTTHYNVVDLNADLLPGSSEFRGTDPTATVTTDHYIWAVPTGTLAVTGITGPTIGWGGDHLPVLPVLAVAVSGTTSTAATGPAIVVPHATLALSGTALTDVGGHCREVPTASLTIARTAPTRAVALRVVQMQFDKATVSPLDRYELWGRAAHPRWPQAYPEQRYVITMDELTDRGTYYTFWYGSYEVTYTYEVMAYTLKPEGWPGRPKEALAVTIL